MAKTLNQTGAAQRRNFRLSPLEMLIVALIILGVLYLMTIWVNSLLGQGSQARETHSSPLPLAQMEQFLIASEKAAAKLSSLEKSLEQSRKEVADLKKSLASGSGNKALALRVSQMEKKLAGLKSAPAGNPAKADAALAAKVGALEKAVAQNSKASAKIKELEKTAAGEARLQQSLKDLDRRLAANEGLPEKVASLEKQMAVAGRLEARLKALEQKPAGNPELAQKVRDLEKRPAANPEDEARLKALEDNVKSLAKNESRLRNLESGLVGLAQERGDASRRLDRMERRLAALQQAKSPAAGQAPAIPQPPADAADELARERIRTLTRQVAELKAELEKIRTAKARPAPRPPAAPRAEAPPAPSRPTPKTAAEPPKTEQTGTRLIRHVVRRGDTLYGISRKYKVKVSDLRRWNPQLVGRKYLWIGENLAVYK